MMGLSSGRYTVIRGSAANDYGDEVDGTAIVAQDVLGSVVERTRTNFDPASSRVDTVRFLVGRFNSNADIQDGDRIKDQKTEEVFVVNSVSRGANLIHKSDVVVDLTKA